jgi:hypothetical protein
MGPRHSLVGEMKNAEKTTSKVIIKSCGREREGTEIEIRCETRANAPAEINLVF